MFSTGTQPEVLLRTSVRRQCFHRSYRSIPRLSFPLAQCKRTDKGNASTLSQRGGKVTDMKSTGQRIRDERVAKQWTQQRLADEISRIKGIKISRAAVALWESGLTKTQRAENLFAAGAALGLTAQWVMDGQGDKYESREASVVKQDAAPFAVHDGRGERRNAALTTDELMILDGYRVADEKGKIIIRGVAREYLAAFDKRNDAVKKA